MRPCNATAYVADAALRDAEHCGYIVLTGPGIEVDTDMLDGVRRQLRAASTASPIASAGGGAALTRHVVHVGGVVSEEKVCRLNAGSVVASVKDKCSGRDISPCENPSNAVSAPRAPSDLEHAISAGEAGRLPHETPAPVVSDGLAAEPTLVFTGYDVASHVDLLTGSQVRLGCDVVSVASGRSHYTPQAQEA